MTLTPSQAMVATLIIFVVAWGFYQWAMEYL